MTADELAEHVERIRTAGYTILEGIVPADAVAEMAAAFEPLYESHLDTIRESPNRGPMRHYISLPFAPPFYQSAFNGNPDIFAIVRAILGEDAYSAQFATDTPAKGSEYQDWHGDIPPLFPDYDECLLPPSVIAANLSFVDVTPANGPFEVCDGSHRINDAIERLTNGELPFKPLCLKVGDVLVRDPRCVHRGTPNRTDTPRPVAVLAFNRANHRLVGHTDGNIRADFYESLSDTEKRMYRLLRQTA